MKEFVVPVPHSCRVFKGETNTLKLTAVNPLPKCGDLLKMVQPVFYIFESIVVELFMCVRRIDNPWCWSWGNLLGLNCRCWHSCRGACRWTVLRWKALGVVAASMDSCRPWSTTVVSFWLKSGGHRTKLYSLPAPFCHERKWRSSKLGTNGFTTATTNIFVLNV